MLPALARAWKASRLRHGGTLAILERLRYSTSLEGSPSRQNKEHKNSPPSSPAVTLTTPPPPSEPAPEECCGKGCEECVWTVYWNEYREYQISLAEAQGIERTLDPFEVLEQRLSAAKEKKKKN
jgi:hypothetical protein